jgi:hypothetical protein
VATEMKQTTKCFRAAQKTSLAFMLVSSFNNIIAFTCTCMHKAQAAIALVASTIPSPHQCFFPVSSFKPLTMFAYTYAQYQVFKQQ